MANQPVQSDDEVVNSLIQKFGGNTNVTSPNPLNASVSNSTGSSDDELINGLVQRFGQDNPPKEGMSPEDLAYEKKVQSYGPEAQERVQKLGASSAIGTGALEQIGLGPVVREAVTDVKAGLGYGEGNTFSERRENLKARYEALRRAAEEQYPVTYTVSDVGSNLLSPIGGEIAGPAKAGLEAIGAGKTVSTVGGLAAEGATLGGLGAAAENVFGSKAAQDQPGIGESALIGGVGGALIGGVGTGVSAAFEKAAPPWMKSLGGKDNFQIREFAKAYDKDVKSGNVNMSLDEFQEAAQNGQPVQVSDLGGPEVQKFIQAAFKNQPEMADLFKAQLISRLGEGQSRFEKFAQTLTDSDLNADRIKTEAQRVAKEETNANYEAAYDPNNGRGSWNNDWNSFLKVPQFQQAAIDAESALARDAEAKAAFTGGKPVDVGSPFTSDEAGNLQRTNAKGQFINTDGVNVKYVDYLQKALNQKIDSLTDPLDAGVKNTLIQMRRKIVDDLINEKSDFYNPLFKKAYNSLPLFRGENDAFSYGLNAFKNKMNPLKSSEIANATAEMTDAEKGLFTQGIMADMLAKSRGSDGVLNVNQLNKYFNDGPTQTALKNALGDLKFQDLQRFVNTENLIADATKKAMILGKAPPTMADDFNRMVTFAILERGLILPFLARVGSSYLKQKYITSLIQKLSSNDPSLIRSAYDDMTTNPEIKKGISKFLAFLASRLAMGGAGMPAFEQGGRVGYKDGGATYGLGMGSGPTQPNALLKPEKDPGKVGLISKETMENAKNSAKLGTIHWEKPVSDQETVVQNTIRHRLSDFDIKERTKRATGGRIPEADKLFKAAKREMDNNTKPLLNAHDDHIVHALRIAQGRI